MSYKKCYTRYLKEKYGDQLTENFNELFNLFYNYFDIFCFMGEGNNTSKEQAKFNYYCNIIHQSNKKSALYCGRNCKIEEWMKCFDYIKI